MKTSPLDVPTQETHGASSDKDRAQWEQMEALLEANPHSLYHLMSLWPVYARRINVVRFLAHFKLFEKVINLPGDIVEVGVSRGASLFTWHKLIEIFCPTDTSRKIIGFDSFEGLTDFNEHDGALDPGVGKSVGGWSANSVEREVYALKDIHNRDNVLARERVILVKGRIQDTLPGFLASRPGMRISLLHLDADLYEPTMATLDGLWDLVVPGGVVVFDEYGLPPWAGEGAAFDEFREKRGLTGLKIEKFPWSLTPNGFVIKP